MGEFKPLTEPPQEGDAIAFEEGDVLIIGDVVSVEGNKVKFIEAHAFHRAWGGSSRSRGKEHEKDVAELTPCPSEYRHIVLEQRAKRLASV